MDTQQMLIVSSVRFHFVYWWPW